MSRRARVHRVTDGPPPIEVLEEAIHLLRGAPAAAYALYALGVVPWLAGFLWFWAGASWFAPTGGERAWAALWVAVAFTGLQWAQAEFAGRLYAHRTGAEPPPLTARRVFTVAGAQLRVQVWALVSLPLAALTLVGFGWIVAFHQTASVLGATPEEPGRLRRESWRLALLWTRQNHVIGALVAAFGVVVWLNLLTSAYLLPWLANRVLGIENVFGMEGLAFFNTTFLAIVTALTWLAMDPLLKAVYVLRVFHGRAQQTGDDLRERFARATGAKNPAASAAPATSPSTPSRAPLRAARAALGLALAAWSLAPGGGVTPAHAAAPATTTTTKTSPEPPSASPAVEVSSPPSDAAAKPSPPAETPRVAPAELDRALDATLRDEDFQWALRPLPVTIDAERGPILEFFDALSEKISDFFSSIRRAFAKFFGWLLELIFGKRSVPSSPGGGWSLGSGVADILIWLLVGVAVVLLLWLAWTIWRRASKPPAIAVATAAPSAATPDLCDETLTAAQLPAEGWLDLARQKIAAGEWRLALRALYLASLAQLADEGLLALARHKTNLDYERELTRRAPTRTELVSGFRLHRRGFEDVWYGDTAAAEADVRAWLRELEHSAAAAAARTAALEAPALPEGRTA